jgi:undecaprenyl-phosphate 4-deoxy-4-formamido-L-arabinose transferase
VPVEHFDRAYGKSGYTLNKLISLWSNIMGYSIVPLRMATKLGVTLSVLSIIAAVVIVIRKILRPATAVGWSSMMVTIIFFAGLILFFLGLIGEYIGRMFQGMTHNPQFVVRSVYTQNSAGSVARTQQNVNVNSERRTEDDDPSGEK